MPKSNPRIVVIGGGTGSFTLLQALKNHTNQITALVNMADDGGSTGVLRDELGVLPPGDIRQCLVALSDAPEELRDLFNFRFGSGTFGGHSFGNIFLSAVEKMTDDFNQAVRMAGDVLPITTENCQLVMEYEGQTITGEYAIAQTNLKPHAHPELRLEPFAKITSVAADAINNAELIVIAPGNLYGSLAPALLPIGVKAALSKSSAPIAFVCNLVNKPHHTADFAVHDYAEEIERFIGKGNLTYVLYNEDHPTDDLLERYAVEHEYPVIVDLKQLELESYKCVGGDFLSHATAIRNIHDKFITRSLIRHDSEAVATALMSLLK